MKAEELRIGNLVNRLGALTSITVISADHISTPLSGAVTINQIEPIPLTEEWLLKLGFKDSDIALKFGSSLQIRLNTGHAALWPLDGCTESHNIITDCKYVHQLQNLYFVLTGEKLEVK